MNCVRRVDFWSGDIDWDMTMWCLGAFPVDGSSCIYTNSIVTRLDPSEINGGLAQFVLSYSPSEISDPSIFGNKLQLEIFHSKAPVCCWCHGIGIWNENRVWSRETWWSMRRDYQEVFPPAWFATQLVVRALSFEILGIVMEPIKIFTAIVQSAIDLSGGNWGVWVDKVEAIFPSRFCNFEGSAYSTDKKLWRDELWSKGASGPLHIETLKMRLESVTSTVKPFLVWLIGDRLSREGKSGPGRICWRHVCNLVIKRPM